MHRRTFRRSCLFAKCWTTTGKTWNLWRPSWMVRTGTSQVGVSWHPCSCTPLLIALFTWHVVTRVMRGYGSLFSFKLHGPQQIITQTEDATESDDEKCYSGWIQTFGHFILHSRYLEFRGQRGLHPKDALWPNSWNLLSARSSHRVSVVVALISKRVD